MVKAKGYEIFKIEDRFFLLPYGQQVADLQNGIELNEIGVHIWNNIENFQTPQDLIDNYISMENIDPSIICDVKKDLTSFISSLKDMGYIYDKSPNNLNNTFTNSNLLNYSISLPNEFSLDSTFINISGINISLEGDPIFFSKDFDLFKTFDKPKSHCRFIAVYGDTIDLSNFTLVLKNNEVILSESSTMYHMNFPSTPNVNGCHMAKDGSFAIFYIDKNYDPYVAEDLFYIIRLPFMYIAQLRNKYVLHSASFLYKEKAWLFTGPSGTGKSTHTNLWKKLLNVSFLNGDLNVITQDESGTPIVEGLPWCGTSEIYTEKKHPLGGIIILNQSSNNIFTKLDETDKVLSVFLRLISPSWTPIMIEQNLNFIHNIKDSILIGKLNCNMDDEACYTMQKEIDRYLKETQCQK